MRKFFWITLLVFVSTASFAEDQGWDPTQPSPEGSYVDNFDGTSSHGLRLDGIFSEPNKSTIIINGKVLHIGESIGDYKVTEISKNSVTLKSKTNESFVLKFADFNFKQLRQ
ncbi:MAG: hypothetical protein SFW07_07795 [Gammaproteobacteria bacterium]|nr:hypothetical protein [Gammaproteobacteria bacterium]